MFCLCIHLLHHKYNRNNNNNREHMEIFTIHLFMFCLCIVHHSVYVQWISKHDVEIQWKMENSHHFTCLLNFVSSCCIFCGVSPISILLCVCVYVYVCNKRIDYGEKDSYNRQTAAAAAFMHDYQKTTSVVRQDLSKWTNGKNYRFSLYEEIKNNNK